MFRSGWGFLVGVMAMGVGCDAMAATPSEGKVGSIWTAVGQEMKALKKRFCSRR